MAEDDAAQQTAEPDVKKQRGPVASSDGESRARLFDTTWSEKPEFAFAKKSEECRLRFIATGKLTCTCGKRHTVENKWDRWLVHLKSYECVMGGVVWLNR
jgi:hypothetical protein